jgi:hypothetical protein
MFASVEVGDMNIYTDKIVHNSGRVWFDNNNLETTGTLTVGNINGSPTSEWDTAYTHSQDNSQAHTDYLVNNANDTTSGTLSMATGSTIGNLTLANGSITDSSDAISFGDDNLSTTGYIDISGSGGLMSKFGPAPDILAVSDTTDVLVSTISITGTSGTRRAGAFFAEFAGGGGSNSSNIMGLNAFAYTHPDSTDACTRALWGGKYASRVQGSGQVDAAYGVGGRVQNSLGGATVVFGADFYSEGPFVRNSGTIQTAVGLYLGNGNAATSGVIDNHYQIYNEPPTAATTSNWFIYSSGGNSAHVGNLRLGDTNVPTDQLEVNGVSVLGDGGASHYVSVNATGDTVFVGGAGLVFGHMYTNSTIAVTLTDQNTWYELDGATAWTTGQVHNTTFTDPAITVLEPGMYEVIWTLSTDFSASPGASQQIEYGIMIGGSIQNEGRAHRTLANSTDTGHCSGVAILDLADNAVISLAARNITSAGKILHVEHGNMTVKQLGGT